MNKTHRTLCLEELEPLVLPSGLYGLARQELNTAALFAAAPDTTASIVSADAALRDRLTALVAAQETAVEKLSLTCDVAKERLDQAEKDGLPPGKIAVRTIILAEAVADYAQAVEDLEQFRAVLLAPDAKLADTAQAVSDRLVLVAIGYKKDAADTVAAAKKLRDDGAGFADLFPADVAAAKATHRYNTLVTGLAALQAATKPPPVLP